MLVSMAGMIDPYELDALTSQRHWKIWKSAEPRTEALCEQLLNRLKNVMFPPCKGGNININMNNK
jgi:hypothetical protein